MPEKKDNVIPLEPVISKLEQLLLYETISHFYLVGFDEDETAFRVLKIDRRIEKPISLTEIVHEDSMVYNKTELHAMLQMINEGNKSSGGLVKLSTACGLIGFVKFLDCYYLNLITQKKLVGMIGANCVYAVKENTLYPIRPKNDQEGNTLSMVWNKLNKRLKINVTSLEVAESRYMGLFQFVDITKDFYFSYTYDLTQSLQHNYIMCNLKTFPPPPPQECFEWNHYLTNDLRDLLGDSSSSYWILPIIHGSYEQRKFSIFGRILDMTLIARRSRHYAGTRYLKRGISVHGKVANDCETEQILQLDGGQQATYASYVQVRGSIPTYWHQETSVTMPKPPILINRIDPFYLATHEHFKDLLQRYNAPIIVLDLVKQYERKPREMIVGREYRFAVEEMNLSIPLEMQIRYCALDHTRITKTKSSIAVAQDTSSEWAQLESSLRAAAAETRKDGTVSTPAKSEKAMLLEKEGRPNALASESSGRVARIDILRQLEDIAIMTISETAVFSTQVKYLDRATLFQDQHVNEAYDAGYIEQRGVLRTNCIDCLDRTNGGQFAMAMKFLSVALRVLGLTNESTIDPSSNLLLSLIDMFGVMGDRISLQYGGSEAHKKMSFIKAQTPKASNQGGELLTSIKRYYSNAFTDNVKQDAMNVFLGYYIPTEYNLALWDFDTDYHLHNKTLRPPVPEVNNTLFNELRRRGPAEDKGKLNRSGDTIADIIDSAPSIVDIEKLSKKYFTNPRRANETQLIEKAIKRREKRKFIANIVNKRVCEAVELWWKGAIHDYYAKRSWMCLPPPVEGLAKGYFERMYQVNELTSFDNLLASELMNPTNATSTSRSNAKTIRKGNRIDDDEDEFEGNHGAASISKNQNTSNALPIAKRISVAEQVDGFRIEDDVDLSPAPIGGGGLVYNASSNNLVRGYDDSIDADVDSLASSKGGGFQLGRYVREIGIKARTLVGGFLRKDDQVLLNSIPQEIFKKEGPSDTQWDWSKQDFSHANSMMYQNPGYSYTNTKYAEISRNNILMMEDMSFLTSPEEYANSIRECNIDVDDVAAMERLAVDGYISSIIPTGIYAGMERKESAVSAQGFISSSMNMIENELQRCLDPNGFNIVQEQNRVHLDTEENIIVSSPIPKETRGTIQRRGSKNDSSKRKGSYDLVPSYSKKHLKKLVSQAKSAPGLEDELLSNASQYIQQQAKYSNEIDIERLSKRISSLTVEKSILEYARILDKEIVASSIDDITFIASDDPQYQSFYELQNILHTLSPLKEMYSVKAKELRVKASKEVVVENPKKKKYTNPLSMLSFKKYKEKTAGKKEAVPTTQPASPSILKQVEEAYAMNSLAKARISKDYEGFTSLAPDLYARISNPLLNMNEIAVIAWNRSQARKEEKK